MRGDKAYIKARVKKNREGCWIWQSYLGGGGYGACCRRGVRMPAHRLAYMAWKGPIPKGKQVHHVCHKAVVCTAVPCIHRRCCNPAHLKAVTPKENVRAGNQPLGGWVGPHAKRTRCPQGHPYDGVNANGRRICHRCQAASAKKHRRRKGVRPRTRAGHGTRACYRRGCRRPECVRANTLYARGRVTRQK